MDIYLVRHGHALSLEEQGIDNDEDRTLSLRGEEQARQVGLALQRLRVEPDVVVTTPLLRARRTAELLLQDWPAPIPEILVADALTPECKPRKLAKFLKELGRERVVVVGHQPDLSEWSAWLIGSKKAYIDFAKGGLAYIDWDSEVSKGTGALVWLVTPDWYASLERSGTAPATDAADHSISSGAFPAHDDFSKRA